MASASQAKLEAAITAVVSSFQRLEAASLNQSSLLGGAQAEQFAAFEAQAAQYEAALAEAVSENTFLKEDNLRLSNQLQTLQKEYLALQKAANGALVRLDASVKQIDLMLEH